MLHVAQAGLELSVSEHGLEQQTVLASVSQVLGSQACDTATLCVWLVDRRVECGAVFLMSWFLPTGTMTPVKTQHSLAGQLYAVPLIQPDLRREEAIQQVADALQYLQNISGDIFSRWDLLYS